MTIAVSPGSFDPLTLGHVDVIERARKVFDEVIVAVAVNSSKQPLFSLAERLEIAREALADLDGVRVEPAQGLLVDFCRSVGATAIIKGLRGGADFDAELPMALMNRHLVGVETMFIIGDQNLAHIASSLVKDVARHGGRIDDLVPSGVADRIHRALGARARHEADREVDREAGPEARREAASEANGQENGRTS